MDAELALEVVIMDRPRGALFDSESDSEISNPNTLGRNMESMYIERCTEQLARIPPDASGIPGPSTHLNPTQIGCFPRR